MSTRIRGYFWSGGHEAEEGVGARGEGRRKKGCRDARGGTDIRISSIRHFCGPRWAGKRRGGDHTDERDDGECEEASSCPANG